MAYSNVSLAAVTAQGAFIGSVPTGFVSMDPTRADIHYGIINSGTTIYKGEILAFSGAYLVTVTGTSYNPGDIAGVSQLAITAAAGGTTQVPYDRSICDGVPFKGLCSDAAVTTAAKFADGGSTNGLKILISAAVAASALFRIVDVIDTTNKVVSVVLNRTT